MNTLALLKKLNFTDALVDLAWKCRKKDLVPEEYLRFNKEATGDEACLSSEVRCSMISTIREWWKIDIPKGKLYTSDIFWFWIDRDLFEAGMPAIWEKLKEACIYFNKIIAAAIQSLQEKRVTPYLLYLNPALSSLVKSGRLYGIKVRFENIFEDALGVLMSEKQYGQFVVIDSKDD